MRRHISWDDVELPFGDPPSTSLPSVETLRRDLEVGRIWVWDYKGLKQFIPREVMSNALQDWDDWQMNKHRREPVPNHVGRFFWAQTSTAKDAEKPLDASTRGDAASGDEPHH